MTVQEARLYRESVSKLLIGKSIAFAIEYLKENNISYRLLREGKNSYIQVNNHVMDRAGLEVDDSILTHISWG
jgi:hypothetical protein